MALILAVVHSSPSPSPSPSASPLPVIGTVRVATGSAQTLHALPVAAAVLDRAAIASSPAYSADGLLRSLPGFDRSRSNSMFTNYGQLRVSFAGAGNDRGLVLADQFPAQDGFGGQVDWAAFPVNDLQSAELLLGAGSALYGTGASAGVLDLQTFGPGSGELPPQATLSLGAGNNAYSEQWFNSRATIAPRLNASVALQQQRLQYFALTPPYASPIDRISQADTSMASMRVRYAAGDRDSFEVGARGAWDDQFYGRPNYSFSRRFDQLDLRYIHATPQSSVQTGVYTRTTFVQNLADLFPSQPGVLRYIQNVPTNESGAGVRWIVSGGASTFEMLADARHVGGGTTQFGQDGVFANSGGGLQNTGGIGAQETWRIDRFEVVAGARFDTVRSYGMQLVSVSKGNTIVTTPPDSTAEAVSPRIAFRYDLSPHLALRASSGNGLRAPFLNELVRGFFIGSVQYKPNPFLVPERSNTTSAGLDYLASKSHLSFDYFDTTVSDAIMFRTIDPAHQIRSNVAHTQTNSYLLSYTRDLGTCSRVTAWFGNQNARVTEGPAAIVGKQLQYVPQQSASLQYSARVGEVATGVSVSYAGQTYADDLNTEPLGTAVLLGATLGIPIAGGAQVELRGDNITSARYSSSIDRFGPPALVSVGVSLPIGGTEQAASGCLP